jgi:hypothetical protein
MIDGTCYLFGKVETNHFFLSHFLCVEVWKYRNHWMLLTLNLFTLFRMFSPSPSPLTTVKSSLDHETRPSSCGTLWLSASTPSKKMDTAIGFRAFVSHQTRSIQSSCQVRNLFKLLLFSINNFKFFSSRLGSHRQGLELDQLQAKVEPLRTQRLLEHRHRLTRWLALHIRRQGLQSLVVGFE